MKLFTNFLEIALIFLLFALYGAYAVPDTNEAHYLGKAAHFWNPNYVQNDFFLNSPDAHGVFYNKSEVWIESERLYEVLYSFEMEG